MLLTENGRKNHQSVGLCQNSSGRKKTLRDAAAVPSNAMRTRVGAPRNYAFLGGPQTQRGQRFLFPNQARDTARPLPKTRATVEDWGRGSRGARSNKERLGRATGARNSCARSSSFCS